MLLMNHPYMTAILAEVDYGLWPVCDPRTGDYFLIVKATKEVILTAREKNEFRIYLIRDAADSQFHLGVMTAFFDDHDEPLVIKTLLFSDDKMLEEVIQLFSMSEFEIYFFDEHNRELLGAKALNRDFERFTGEIGRAHFYEFDRSSFPSLMRRLEHGFAVRDQEDDRRAFSITIGERLYPDDLVIVDARDEAYCFNDADETVAVTTLERDVEPGPMQERDLARMMSRVFTPEQIYLNPYRSDTDKELTDILVVTDDIFLFVQAKDSPNTASALSRSIDRKRKTTQGHIVKASAQMRGALTYAKNNDGISIKTSNGTKQLPLAGKQLVGLVVVRELFDDSFCEASAPILKLVLSLEIPVILMDYSGYHIVTQHLRDPVIFVNGLFEMLDVALENEQFPKPAWSGPPI